MRSRVAHAVDLQAGPQDTSTPLLETERARATPHQWLALSLLVCCALLIRIPGLTESLWYDELWSTRIKLGSVGDLLRTALFDIHPPLYSALLFLWVHVFGDSEVSVRLIP